MSKYQELKRLAYEANMEIPRQGLAIYTFGNASAYDADLAAFAIKPSGVPYERLAVRDMVVVAPDNTVLEGSLRPSSDTKTHACLYRNFREIGGICHTHSAYAVAWAQAMKPIPIFGTTHADHLTVPVPVTQVMSDEAVDRDYEEETGNQILAAMKGMDPHEVEMILVACHGPFTWGKDAATAVYNSAVLEELARMALLTVSIDPATPELKESIRNKHYRRKHGRDAYYGQQ